MDFSVLRHALLPRQRLKIFQRLAGLRLNIIEIRLHYGGDVCHRAYSFAAIVSGIISDAKRTPRGTSFVCVYALSGAVSGGVYPLAAGSEERRVGGGGQSG